jgi:hypothetical protein
VADSQSRGPGQYRGTQSGPTGPSSTTVNIPFKMGHVQVHLRQVVIGARLAGHVALVKQVLYDTRVKTEGRHLADLDTDWATSRINLP